MYLSTHTWNYTVIKYQKKKLDIDQRERWTKSIRMNNVQKRTMNKNTDATDEKKKDEALDYIKGIM